LLKLIQPISKKNQVVLAIKEAIISGEVQPGDQIVESRLAQELGSGIPLVREALIELEHQGFVQKIPYKGTMVTKLGSKEIREIFQLRVELEALAIEWAHDNVTSEDIKDLQVIIGRMAKSAEQLNLDKFYEADLQFHRKLWVLAGNSYLSDTLERVVVPLFAFFVMKTRREKASYIESAAMHAKIVEALDVKSTPELRELMKDSLRGWKDDMLKLLFSET
jgi:DNA-binding GntR family transcriptional regulator